MRWRALLVVLLVGSLLPLFAQNYRSNSLAMELELLLDDENLQESPYLLVSEYSANDNKIERLYHQSKLIKEIRYELQSRYPERLVILETDYEEEEVVSSRRTLYVEGLPSTYVEQTPTTSQLSWYSWHEGTLESIRTLYNRQTFSSTYYVRSQDGSLAAALYQEDDSLTRVFYFPTSGDLTLISAGNAAGMTLYTFEPSSSIASLEGEIVELSVTSDAVGNYQVEQRLGGVRFANTYREDGLLLHQTVLDGPNAGLESLYHYDENNQLTLIIENHPFPLSSSVKRWYDGGDEVLREEYLEGELQKRGHTLEDGTYHMTLFVEGKAYVDLLYTEEGGKVVEISYY